jgi:hypothetical protein
VESHDRTLRRSGGHRKLRSRHCASRLILMRPGVVHRHSVPTAKIFADSFLQTLSFSDLVSEAVSGLLPAPNTYRGSPFLGIAVGPLQAPVRYGLRRGADNEKRMPM